MLPTTVVRLLVLSLLLAGSAGAQVCPGLTGEAAIDCVHDDYRPSRVLSGSQSKDRMMDTIWKTSQGGQDGVIGVYTGRFVAFDGNPSSDPNQDVFNGGSGLNQEHVWPRSQGTDGNAAETDLHHLFPTDVRTNADRGSLPFGTLDDGARSTWYQGTTRQSGTPADPKAWSQLSGGTFEPRAEIRGDVARAMFYVAAVYKDLVSLSWFEGQVEDLLQWHLDDPATGAERTRSSTVATLQSGCGSGSCTNPFVDDPTLAARAFGDGSANAAPTALDDDATTDEGQSVTISVLGNDTDPDTDLLAVIAVSRPSNGSAATDGTTVTYTPAGGFTGADAFDYTISDGFLLATATVTVTVNAVSGNAPTAADDEATLDEDGEVVVDVLANDAGPGPLALGSVGDPSNGTATAEGGTIRYVPDADFFGTDAFAYTVSNSDGSDVGTVSITILPVNDAPVAPAVTSPGDGAALDATADAQTPVTISWAEGTDPEGDALTYTWELSAGGAVQVAAQTDLTSVTLPLGQIASALVGFEGTTVEATHRIVASDGSASSEGLESAITIRIRRNTSAGDGPEPFAIAALGPNPSAGVAVLTLVLPTAGPVRAEVYDALGRLVASGDARLAAGRQPLALDLAGVPVGAYVVRVTAGDAVATRQLVVAR